MDMFTSYGHIIKLKKNHRFFYDFRPGHVPLTLLILTLHCHLHLLQAANCCRNSRLVVDEDDLKSVEKIKEITLY